MLTGIHMQRLSASYCPRRAWKTPVNGSCIKPNCLILHTQHWSSCNSQSPLQKLYKSMDDLWTGSRNYPSLRVWSPQWLNTHCTAMWPQTWDVSAHGISTCVSNIQNNPTKPQVLHVLLMSHVCPSTFLNQTLKKTINIFRTKVSGSLFNEMNKWKKCQGKIGTEATQ